MYQPGDAATIWPIGDTNGCGELAGLEGTISLWRTEHTGVSAAPFRERRRDRKQRSGLRWFDGASRMSLLLLGANALLFVPGLHHRGVVVRQPLRSGGAGIGMASEPLPVDVSDLGVTMDDLKAPISDVMEVEASGCESTSRISPDSGCVWSETASRMEAQSHTLYRTPTLPQLQSRASAVVLCAEPAPIRAQVTLTIPGLLGQPADSLAVEVTETTATVTAFGRAVWSCVRTLCRNQGPA